MTEIISINTALRELGLYGDRVEFELPSPEIGLAINDDGVTWTKIPNMVASSASGFSATGGTLTKINNSGIFLMNGVSDLEVNKAVEIFYALALNGSVVPSEITAHTFAASSKIENISITALAPIAIGDEIEVWAKGDGTSGVTIDITKLDVTFKEAAPNY